MQVFVGAVSFKVEQLQGRPAAAEQLTFGAVGEIEPNIAPDGRWLAYQYFSEQNPHEPRIGIMDTLTDFQSAKPLVDHHGYAGEMSWSPDSKWLSFTGLEKEAGSSTEQIYRVNVVTKEILQVTNFPRGTLIGDSTTWSKSGVIGFEQNGIIYGVNVSGGEDVELLDTRAALGNRRPSTIRLSPDGTTLLFSVETKLHESEIWVANLRSKLFRRLTRNHYDLFATWYDERHVAFSRETKNGGSNIYVLDLDTRKLYGLTFGHVDFMSSADPARKILYFSRNSRMPNRSDDGPFFSGFHAWQMKVPPNVIRPSDTLRTRANH
jgi:Tol biopolymer transport system component